MLVRSRMSRHDIDTEFINDGFGELFFDEWSGTFFRSSKTAILWGEMFVNKSLHKDGKCYVNDFYEKIGMTTFNEEFVWELSGRCQWVDFDHIYVDQEDGSESYYYIVFIPEPIAVKRR